MFRSHYISFLSFFYFYYYFFLVTVLYKFCYFLQKDKDSVRLYKWQHCCLSQAKLVKPIVACELGRLYNKEAIIEKLLNDKSEGSNANSDGTADHIKSLKVRNFSLSLSHTQTHTHTHQMSFIFNMQHSKYMLTLESQCLPVLDVLPFT